MNSVVKKIFGDDNSRVSGDAGFRDLVAMLRKQSLRLPLYQRDAVWTDGQISALWDSLLRGFPLPPFLVSVPSEAHPESRTISLDGRRRQASDSQSESGQNEYLAVVDGQQRLMAIALCVGLERDTAVRLWVDLAPPSDRHPFGFAFWIHPCSKAFPFGYRMTKGSEHDFEPPRDDDYVKIWERFQNEERDIYQISLDESYPFHAVCPFPLDKLMAQVTEEEIEWSYEDFKQAVMTILATQKFCESNPELKEKIEPVIKRLHRALSRLLNSRFSFQKLMLDLDSKEDSDAELTFFERLGRGGLQITQRQLAASRILRRLGTDGHDAVAHFQGSTNPAWRTVLDTEELIHAVSRVAYAEAASQIQDNEKDLPELNLQRLSALEKRKQMHEAFYGNLRSWCRECDHVARTRLQAAFESVFEALAFDPETNPYGVPLVQMAYSSSTKDGIHPVTLHPLLRWALRQYPEQPTREVREDMVRWVLFSNGVATNPTHAILQKYAFMSLNDGAFSFERITEEIFKDRQEDGLKLRRDLGLAWDRPTVEGDRVVLDLVDRRRIPSPEERAELFLQRLFFQNWVWDPINSFLLLWSQRTALHELYGAHAAHLPALFSKGRPFDRDHIVARNCFLGDTQRFKNDHMLEASKKLGCEIKQGLPTRLTPDCFRHYLKESLSNFRYWPRFLNRSDGTARVKVKLELSHIAEKVKKHPLERHFKGRPESLPWEWSRIPEQSRDDWSKLPPEDSAKWDADSVTTFIRCLRDRQLAIYGEVYGFLTAPMDKCLKGIG